MSQSSRRILIWSDLHAHTFSAYSTILPNGMNSRLADCISCVQQVREYALENDITEILFLGDLFHERRHINVQAFNAVYDEIVKFKQLKLDLYMLVGNHDQASRDGTTHSLHGLYDKAHVIGEPKWISTKSGISILGIPYMEDKEQIKSLISQAPKYTKNRLFLGHLGVQGMRVGSDFVYSNPFDVSVDDLSCSEFDRGFMGHYHEAMQEISSNFMYVGAPLQHSWSDVGQERGFLVYDLDSDEVTMVPLKAPKFIQVKESRLKNFKYLEGNFIRITSNRIWDELEKQELRDSSNARSIEVEVTLPEQANEDVPRISLNPSMAPIELIKTYVKSDLVDKYDLDENYLIQIASEVLKEI
jgi:DNA repair exonuclease SbcCD nuclease subunit